MKATLSTRVYVMAVFLCTGCLISIAGSSQTWSFRNGFGQSGAANSLSDEGRAICTDAAGNVYVTGKISDDLVGNTVSFGGAALVSAGDDDGFVAKFNAAGVHQWSLRFGGPAFVDIGNGIATDGTSVYVAGTANGDITVGTSPTVYTAAGSGMDGVIMKLNAATGSVDWVNRFGGNNSDEAQAICLDPSGNVYVSGIFRTRTTNPTATFGPFSRTVQGNSGSYTSDLFVAKLNSSGAFQWVSTGGIQGSNDNINGSGICYVPGTGQIIVTGSFRAALGGSVTATYATTAPVSSVMLTNSGAVVNEDFCLLELDSNDGRFLAGTSAGSSDGNEAGYGVTYDPFTGHVYFAGSFSSASVTFPGMPAIVNAAPTRDNIMYGRYNPITDTYVWVKDSDNGAAASATDVARAISTNGVGRVLIAGRFNNTITFPGGLFLTAAGARTDIFVARIDVSTGNADYVTQGQGNHAAADDIGYGIAGTADGNFWITGVYATSTVFGSLPPLSSSGGAEDILLAGFADAPTITAHPLALNACLAAPAEFTITAGGANLSYSWQEANNSTFTAGLVTLSNTGVYSGANTNILNIADNTGLNGKYYRAIVSNAGGSMTSNGSQLTVQSPALPGANASVTQTVTDNNLFYATGCALVAKVVPSGASPVSGTVTSQVWVEGTVPTEGNDPFVQRHYEILPAANASSATGTVTLYFTQAEFDNFNAHALSALDLPAGPADAAGIANLRVSKYPGTTNNGSGLPSSYTTTPEVIDPPDANIIFNSTFNRWELTLDVDGFSGFFVQTDAGILPVNLLSFTAQWVSNQVRLNWKTAGEWEHKHFEVERSADGNNFITIGQLDGRNGTLTQQYTFTDTDAGAAAKLYYRLKMVSTSGEITYSRMVVVIRDNDGSLITAVLPNPFTHSLSFGINAPRNGKMNVFITDMTGKRLVSQSIFIEKGFSTQTINKLQHLSKGIYSLVIEFDGKISAHKIVK